MSSKRWRQLVLAALGALALAGCHKPVEVHPALWLVEGPNGQKAWLFGTIHALHDPVDWRSDKIESALRGSDSLLVEVAHIEQAPAIFAELSHSPGLPPLRERVSPAMRPAFDAVMAKYKLDPATFDGLETWAAALALQQAIAAQEGIENENGVDRALVADYMGPVDEFEGARRQLAIFDGLPEEDQRVLLESVLRDGAQPKGADLSMQQGWANGDLQPILAETERGFLNDPELRTALLTGRNRAWTARLVALLRGGAHPFVAVGAGHMAGPEGLPALLAAQGYKVTRLQ